MEQKNKHTEERNLLPFHIIKAASEGDVEAIHAVLAHYEGYIAKLSTRTLRDEDGNTYLYVDEEIPFLSMVLKGVIPMYSDYVNFEANKNEFFLQMVEAGVYPSFYLTYEKSSDLIYTNSSDLYSTEFSTYRDVISEYDKALREVNDAVKDAFITKHEKAENGVTVVTYSNGVKIYVNYTGTAQTVDGVTVDGMSYSYKVGEAE